VTTTALQICRDIQKKMADNNRLLQHGYKSTGKQEANKEQV